MTFMFEKPYYSPTSTSHSLKALQIKDKSWIYIGWLVVFLHIFLPLLSVSSSNPKKETRKKVIVQTVLLNSSQQATLPPSKSTIDTLLAQSEITQNPPQPVENKAEPEVILPEPIPTLTLPKPPPPPAESKTHSPAPKTAPKPPIPQQPTKPKPVPKPAPKPVTKTPPKPASKPQVSKPTPKKIDPKIAEAAQKKAKEAQELEKRKQKEREEQAELKRQTEAKRIAERQAILANVQAKLNQGQKERNQIAATSTGKSLGSNIPDKIANLQIEAFAQDFDDMAKWSAKEVDYRDEVTHILQNGLKLPEYGTVKIELTINKIGKIEKIKVISSESTKNKLYVEKNILSLHFPAFGNRFQNQENYTFPITLNNRHLAK